MKVHTHKALAGMTGAALVLAALMALAGCRGGYGPNGGGGDGDGDDPGSSPPPASTLPVEMVDIPAGSFTMGDETNTDFIATPQHSVTLTAAFKMGKYEVTQGQWYEVMGGDRPSFFTTNPEDGGADGWKTLPVERVSWYDALVFCNKLSLMEGRMPAYSIGGITDPAAWGTVPISSNSTWDSVVCTWSADGYRLPTEAQWEYAARGGNSSPGAYLYAGSNTPGDVGWYDVNSGGKPHQVGKKAANGLGLYDMSGNVYEWCWDRYATGYTIPAPLDPEGPSSGPYRVERSGCFDFGMGLLRSAWRRFEDPSFRNGYQGFRIVRP